MCAPFESLQILLDTSGRTNKHYFVARDYRLHCIMSFESRKSELYFEQMFYFYFGWTDSRCIT